MRSASGFVKLAVGEVTSASAGSGSGCIGPSGAGRT